jgi:hypothetical protein
MNKILLGLLISNLACNDATNANLPNINNEINLPEKESVICNKTANTIATRFAPPSGFIRQPGEANSIDFFMRNLPLKPYGSKVLWFFVKSSGK